MDDQRFDLTKMRRSTKPRLAPHVHIPAWEIEMRQNAKPTFFRRLLNHLRRKNRSASQKSISESISSTRFATDQSTGRRSFSTISFVSEYSDSMLKPQINAEPYSWPHDGTFDPKTTALVIIDMQRDFCSPEGYLHYQGYDITPILDVIPRIQTLLSAFRAANFPIYHTREGHRPDLSTLSSREAFRSRNNPSTLGIGSPGPLGRLLIRGEPGHAIIPELMPLSNENVIDKPGRSAFQHTEFGLMLGIKGIKNLVICGVTTDVCVSSTMREANDNGFDCLLVEDACAASERELHEAAVKMVGTEGGIFGAVSSVERVVEALGGGK